MKRILSHRAISFLVLVMAAGLLVEGFQLSMVSSARPFRGGIPKPLPRPSPPFPSVIPGIPSILPGSDISSALISQLAIVALKVRLADQSAVSCDVTSTSSDLMLRGRVGPVTVKGKGWRSGLGLTCRAIEATVDTCELDLARIITKQKLVLTTPAMGTAMVALNHLDFANFITHPLMRPPTLPPSSPRRDAPIEFLKEDTQIDPTTGQVTFFATFAGAKWKCTLERGSADKRALVKTVAVDSNTVDELQGAGAELTETLSRFFNAMVFELDGTFLSFRDILVTGKGSDPSVMLALNIKVKKFPSAGLAF